MFKALLILFLLGTNMDITAKEMEMTEALQATFLEAIDANDLAQIKVLVSEGYSPDFGLKDHSNKPLILALLGDPRFAQERDEITSYLIEQGAKIDYQYDDGTNVLEPAVRLGLTQSVKALIDKGVDRNQKSNEGRSLLFNVTTLTMLQFLLDNNVSDLKEIDNRGNSLLHHFSDNYANDELIEFLVNNIDVNLQNNEGNTVLHITLDKFYSDQGDKYLVDMILKHKPNLELKNNKGKAALLLAAQYTSFGLETIKKLYAAGADINTSSNSGFQAIHYAATQDPETFFWLADNGADSLAVTSEQLNSTLYLAARNDQINLVKYLLDNDADINQVTQKGETALNVALDKKHDEIIALLKSKNAVATSQEDLAQIAKELERKKAQEAEDKLASYDRLVRAIKAKNLSEIKKYYVEVLNEPKQTINDYEIGSTLIFNTDIEAFSFAVDKGLNVFVKDEDGFSLLHDAVYADKINIVSLLIEKGLDVNALSNDDDSVYEMTKKSSVAVLELLIKANVKIDKNNDVNMARLALSSMNPKMAAYFLEQGYDFPEYLLKHQKYLLRVLQKQNVETLEFLLSKGLDIETRLSVYGEMVTLLHASIIIDSEIMPLAILKAGGDPNARDLSGHPIFTTVFEKNNQVITNAFYNNGANVNDTTGEGVFDKSPFLLALTSGNIETANLLINKGVDVKQVFPKDKDSALHLAARLGDVALLKNLIDHDVDVNLLNEERHAALDISIIYGQKEAEKYLREMEIKFPARKRI